MLSWDCCRTCLSTQNLNPIFSSVKKSDKYMCTLLAAFGLKIELNDNLPQQMCNTCIDFVKKSKQFRKQAEDSLKVLLERLQTAEINCNGIKEENLETKPDSESWNEDNCRDYDDEDDVTLNHFKSQKDVDKTNTQDKFETKIENIFNKTYNIVLEKHSKDVKPTKNVKKKTTKILKRPEKVKAKIECEYCHKLFTQQSIRNHYKKHTGYQIVCEHCGKKFLSQRFLLIHCRGKHGYEKKDKCNYCDYRACSSEQVKIHERKHTGEKPFMCAECGASFYRKVTYLQHKATHLTEKTVQCDKCPLRFKSTHLMQIHQYRHRPKKYTYQCRYCNVYFARPRNVTIHVMRVHDVTPDGTHVKRKRIENET